MGGFIASPEMLLVAHSNPVTGIKAPSELPSGPQAQPGLNTLPQRVLRKEPVTPSALVLMSRSNAQPTGKLAQREGIDLRELGSAEGGGGGDENIKGWPQIPCSFLSCPWSEGGGEQQWDPQHPEVSSPSFGVATEGVGQRQEEERDADEKA